MTSPQNVEDPDVSADGAPRETDRGMRLVPLIGACVAMFVALVAAAVMVAPRLRRR